MKLNYLSLKEGTPATGYWDHAFLNDLLEDMPDSDREVVIIPGAYQGDIIPAINKYLSTLQKVLVFITSDEEGKFDCEKLEHPDMIHYTQYGKCQRRKDFPIGYTSETRKHLKEIGVVNKDIDTFFSGQLNSEERRNVFSRVANIPKSVLHATDGFSKGLKPEQYYDYMAHAKFAPTPPGHVSPDSFRFYEALEAGCIPTFVPDYLKGLFSDMPVYEENWSETSNNQMFAWWIRKKLQLKQQLRQDLNVNQAMTIVVPTSPIPSHPSTEIIDETIASIRKHTAMDIIITIDGVRGEQMDQNPQYQEYIKKLLWKCNFEYENVMPILFDKHVHQSGMMREAMKYIKTPLLMYVEHDTPLVVDREINWIDILKTLYAGDLNVVRLHYETFIPEPHEHLMLRDKNIPGYIATRQWSQRPHIARTDFYQDIMRFFSEESLCFLEDRLYGQAVEADWENWKIGIYAPEDNIQYSRNLDGRAGDRKYDLEGEQIW